MSRSHQITLRLDDSENEELGKLAESLETSKSRVLRETLYLALSVYDDSKPDNMPAFVLDLRRHYETRA